MSDPNPDNAGASCRARHDEDGGVLGIIRRAGRTLPYSADGGYPILYSTGEDTVCAACANHLPAQEIAGASICYEGAPWPCDSCGALVESASGEPGC